MAQINLLKQSGSSYNFWENFSGMLVKICLALLVLLAAYYGWLFWQSGQIDKQITNTQSAVASKNSEVYGMKDRDQALTRQQQVQALNSLIGSHIYWSQLFPVLASSTLKSAYYKSLKVDPQGSIELQVSLPSLEDLDKYMQVFDQPEYNKYFSNLRVSSFSQVQGKGQTSIDFSVKFDFNPGIIKYQQNPGG